MDEVYMEKLIVCTKSRRGSGKTNVSPIRVVREIFNEKGELLAESDDMSFTIETLVDFIKYRFNGNQHDEIIEWAYEYFVKAD